MERQEAPWRSQVGYVWAMIGSAVGYANILSFGAKCYSNGGAAFLVPLVVAFVVLGVPLLILEGVIGKTFRLSLVAAYRTVAGSKGAFFAWLTTLGVVTLSGSSRTITLSASSLYTVTELAAVDGFSS